MSVVKLIAVNSLILTLLLASPLCKAQLTTTATITGVVVDQSGAAIPGAAVTITQTETNTVSRTVSNASGSFVQVGLNPGHYVVTVSESGFATYQETSIYLAPMATYTVSAALKASKVTTIITVRGSDVQVQTATPEISSTVAGQEAQDLPLNGRNYQGLGSLMPGVINSGVGTAMGSGGYTTDNSLSINGQGAAGSLYILDGVWNLDATEHNQNVINPNPDEIAEIKVLQNDYSTKYDLVGTGVVVVQTKSGGDTFHGGGWEFLRNTFLDSRNFFVPPSQGVSPEEWNIFGWELGGPLRIPKVGGIKKTYFYFNNQFVRQKQEGAVTGATPTAAMRGMSTPNNEALFPGTAASPITGSGGPYGVAFLTDPSLPAGHCNSITNDSSCFRQDAGGNWIVPSNRIDPNALYYLNTLANLPNNQTAAFNNYVNSNPAFNSQMDVMAKLDYNFSPKLRLSGEWFIENNNATNPNASRMGSPFSNNWDTFTSSDELGKIGLTQIFSSSMTNQANVSISRLDETHDFGGIRLLSQLSGFTQKLPYSGYYLQQYVPFVSFSGGWSEFGASSCCIVPYAIGRQDGFADDWSWLHGKHFLQAGFTYLSMHERAWNGASAAGSPLSNGTFSFNGQFTSNPIADYLLGLTNSFGQTAGAFRKIMYYPIVSPYVEDQWKATPRLTFTLGLRWLYMPWTSTQAGTSAVFEPSLFNPANTPIVSTTGVITPTANYNPSNGIIINGENGVPLNLLTKQHKNYLSPIFGFAWDVFGTGKTSLRGGYAVTYDKQIEGDCGSLCVDPPLVQQINLINTTFSNPAGNGAPQATAGSTTALDLKNYRAAQVQSFSLSVQQQLGEWLMQLAGAGDASAHMPISNINAPPFPINQPRPTTVNGVAYDFNPLLNTGDYATAYFAPYRGYSSIGLYTSILKANWYALEASLRHSAGHNLFVTAAYTWSHNLDNLGGWINPNILHTAYGNSTASGDIRQVFSATAIYSLPAFQHSSGWERVVLGGWRYSDITAIQSGAYQSVGVSGSGYGLATSPNQVASVTYPKTWKPYKYGAQAFFFNRGTTANPVFAQPSAGYYGNVGNGTIHGPGLINFDMALYKDFPVVESLKLEFRAEYFNVFNHTEPTTMNSTFGSGAFGTITAAKESRIGQLSMKFNF